MVPPVIMHVDMDAFFASVELRRRPDLRGHAVIIGGFPRGVVLSCNYEARARGVRSGMPSREARRLAPAAVFLRPTVEDYSAVTKAIVAVFRTFTSVVEAASIDEAFLDLTGAVKMFGPAALIGERIRAIVRDEQQITCSVGIGPSKFVAKVASRQAKPDGLLDIAPDHVVDFLHPLPVEAMWGVGQPTAEKLHRLGVFTVGELAHTPRQALLGALGPHAGATLHHLAWGRDGRRVVSGVAERTVGSQETFFRDTDDPEVVRREILRMADRSARRMRKAGFLARSVTLGVRFADFTQLTRSAVLQSPSDVTEEIYLQAVELYDRLRLDRPRVRRVGVRVEGLIPLDRAAWQPRLTDPDRGWREADVAIDAAVGRFGPAAVRRASLVVTRR